MKQFKIVVEKRSNGSLDPVWICDGYNGLQEEEN